MSGIVGEIRVFVRIVVVIVELDAVFTFVPFGAAPAGCSGAAAPEFGICAAAGLRERGVAKRGARVVEQRAEALALQDGWRGDAGEVAQRRIDVEQLDQARALFAVGFRAG